jgi:hypothetical protein
MRMPVIASATRNGASESWIDDGRRHIDLALFDVPGGGSYFESSWTELVFPAVSTT